jgi:2-polyprenyl-3-methyl-5-hydroxy-6-metoxy-1,4-benzoquinol methylase
MTSPLIESVLTDWWYYSVELKPGFVTKGICPPELPMLPRMLARDIDMAGMDCLDVGTMEGLMPAMMRRKGAARVLALDAIPHCERKIAALQEAYGVSFDFRRVGLMYDLATKLKDVGGFDLINFSGVNYHVFSPMHCIAGLRPLLKKNGLMIIGTNVVNRGGHSLEFNDRGRLQREANTFWYHSIPMMEYLARYFLLTPIDALYYPHTAVNPATYVPGMDLGYLVMVCRAVEEHEVLDRDEWAKRSRQQSWEFQALCDSARMNAQPRSSITYASRRLANPPAGGVDLMQLTTQPTHVVPSVSDARDSHFLMLDHQA